MDEKRRQFEAQVMPHLDAAYRFARWLSHAPGDADDVVQEAVLRAYRGFDSLRGSDTKAWLLAIVRNCHSTALSQKRRRAFVPLPEEHDAKDGHVLIADSADPQRASILADDARTLDELIAALPEDYREVLILREIEELDYREIAEVIKVPIGTVMSRLSRARVALKKHWHLQSKGGSRGTP
jgi:RNA polymerase sigma-70 factor (ECF subfamily)